MRSWRKTKRTVFAGLCYSLLPGFFALWLLAATGCGDGDHDTQDGDWDGPRPADGDAELPDPDGDGELPGLPDGDAREDGDWDGAFLEDGDEDEEIPELDGDTSPDGDWDDEESEPGEGDASPWRPVGECRLEDWQAPPPHLGWQRIHPRLAGGSALERPDGSLLVLDGKSASILREDWTMTTLPAPPLVSRVYRAVERFGETYCIGMSSSINHNCSLFCLDAQGCWACEAPPYDAWRKASENQRAVYVTAEGEALVSMTPGILSRPPGRSEWFRQRTITRTGLTDREVFPAQIFEHEGRLMAWVSQVDPDVNVSSSFLMERIGHDWVQYSDVVDYVENDAGLLVEHEGRLYIPYQHPPDVYIPGYDRWVNRPPLYYDFRTGTFDFLTLPGIWEEELKPTWTAIREVDGKLLFGSSHGALLLDALEEAPCVVNFMGMRSFNFLGDRVLAFAGTILSIERELATSCEGKNSWVKHGRHFRYPVGAPSTHMYFRDVGGYSLDHIFILVHDQFFRDYYDVIEVSSCQERSLNLSLRNRDEHSFWRTQLFVVGTPEEPRPLVIAEGVAHLFDGSRWEQLDSHLTHGAVQFNDHWYLFQILSYESTVFHCLDTDCPTKIPPVPGAPVEVISDGKGGLWAMGQYVDLYHFDGQTWHVYPTPELPGGSLLRSLTLGEDGVYFGSSEGVYHMNDRGGLTELPTPVSASHKTPLAYAEGRLYGPSFQLLEGDRWRRTYGIPVYPDARPFLIGDTIVSAVDKRLWAINVAHEDPFCPEVPGYDIERIEIGIECDCPTEPVLPERQCSQSACRVQAQDVCIGSKREDTRLVSALDFWMDRYEVTNRRYMDCVDVGVCSLPHIDAGAVDPSYFTDPETANHPVLLVDWFQAHAFCTHAGGRLPTEWEWIVAAQGLDCRYYPWGDSQHMEGYAHWEFVNGQVGDHLPIAVDALPLGASPFGVEQMVGNVSEWTQSPFSDRWGEFAPASATEIPEVDSLVTILGSDFRGYYKIALAVLSSWRMMNPPDYFSETLGFRCVYDSEPPDSDQR